VNRHSFRLKIALQSGLVTGALLLGSGVVLWQMTYRFSLGQLDREIRQLGQANLERVLGTDHWIRLEDALRFVAGGRTAGGFVLWVMNYDQVVYQSPGWPRGLAPEAVPLSDRFEGPAAPPPGQPPPPPPRRGEEISPRNPALPLKTPRFLTYRTDGRNWRVGVMGNPYVTLGIGADLKDLNTRLAGLGKTYAVALVATLLLVAGSAWFLARRALQPVTALTHAAERVTARGLDQRIPAMPGDEEFNRLVTVFNGMLARLERSFQQATRFSADASHELKSPLARLQVELEQALDAAPPGSPSQQAYSSLLDEVGRLKAIVQKLLLLSLADAGQLHLQLEPVNLTRLVQNLVEDCQAQAPHLSVEGTQARAVTIRADASLLEQALQNLATNAIKFNREGGCIHFELAEETNCVRLRVSNSGPGISPGEGERIFERFYRGDASRSGRVEGVGLGLSLSREILRAHGGDLRFEGSDRDLTRFVAELPIGT